MCAMQCVFVKNNAAVTRSIDSILAFSSWFIENGIDGWIDRSDWAVELSEWATFIYIILMRVESYLSLFIYDLFACMTMNLTVSCHGVPYDIQYGIPMQSHKLNVQSASKFFFGIEIHQVEWEIYSKMLCHVIFLSQDINNSFEIKI